MNFRDILLAPLRLAGAFVKMTGRITVGIVGVVIMGAGFLLFEPFHMKAAGAVAVLIGLILTIKALHDR